MQLLEAPKLLQRLQRQLPSHDDDNDDKTVVLAPSCVYWRSPLWINNNNNTNNATNTALNGNSYHQDDHVYFVDVSFDFTSTSSPLAMFGVLMESSSSSLPKAVYYYKSSPLTMDQFKRHFDEIGVDVDFNDASVMAKNMAQALIHQQVTKVTTATNNNSPNTNPASPSSAPTSLQEKTTLPRRLVTIHIMYRDLEETGHLQLELQHESHLDTTAFDLVVSNVKMAEEMEHTLRNQTTTVSTSTEENQIAVDRVLHRWKRRVERMAAAAANRTRGQRDFDHNSNVAAPIHEEPSAAATVNNIQDDNKDDSNIEPASRDALGSAEAPPDTNVTSSVADAAPAPLDPVPSDAVNSTGANINNNKSTVIVKRVVSKSAKPSKSKRRKVGKLTYASNP